MKEKHDFLGKKIIFVNPPDIVRNQLIGILTDKEFEVYSLLDFNKVPKIHDKYPDSIFFLNIDTAQTESEWQLYIKDLSRLCPGIQFGILSFKISDRDQIQYYLLDLGVSCGFIQLKQGVAAATDMMLKVLLVNEVKGRRKFIRYQCQEEDRCTFNFLLDDANLDGNILDISSIGMSCTINKLSQEIVKNQMIRNIQLRLRGVLVNTDVILMGTRVLQESQTVYVFLFNAHVPDKMKTRIRTFICSSLQRNFNREFALKV